MRLAFIVAVLAADRSLVASDAFVVTETNLTSTAFVITENRVQIATKDDLHTALIEAFELPQDTFDNLKSERLPEPTEDPPAQKPAEAKITPQEPKATERVGYPTRSMWWSHPGPRTHANLVAHLHAGEHAGLFDPRWLASLNVDQLEALHSDHHEGKVNWAYARRPIGTAKPPPKPLLSPRGRWVQQTFCNGRKCWTQMVWVAGI